MFWFKKNNNEFKDIEVAICMILIHAARIDNNYEENEKQLIKKCLIKLGIEDGNYISKLISYCEIKETESVEILYMTKEIKKLEYYDRLKILEMLFEVMYSDAELCCLEDRLIRKVAGLIYIENKDYGNLRRKFINDIYS